ncbi:MAG: flavin reductase family protein [Aquificae bacterium]|nr:flavin reductase family protein [Aquificota bacterium]
MEFLTDKTDGETLYKLILSLVVPRPVAWVSSLSREGIPNLAPFSFFNAVNDEPPVLMISVSNRDDNTLKDTVRNIMDTREFVVNMTSEELLTKMIKTGQDVPPSEDEFKLAELTPSPSKLVKPPRIAEAPVSFECKLYKYVPVYDMHVIFGEVLLIHVKDELLDEKLNVNYEAYKPIGRLGGDYYVKAYGNCKIKR